MDFLNQSAFLKALGWSLLNSLWQFALLWILFLFIVYIRKSMNAGLKHALALSFLVTGFLWFAAGLSYRYFAYSEIAGFNEGSLFLNEAGIASGVYSSIASFLDNNLSYISAIYLLVVASLFFKFFRYFYHSHKVQTKGLTKIKAELRMFVDQLAMKLEIRKKVSVWLSENVDTPIIVGFLKPTILIPIACMNQLSIPQLEAVILHELAHIKRNDYLLNLFIAITEIVFFFNPFSRLFMRTIQQERENSCDDYVMQFRFDRYDYASALLSLEKSRSKYLRLSVAATGVGTNKTLLTRVKRIMEVKVDDRINGVRLSAYFLAVALLTFVAFFNPGDLVIRNLAKEFPVVQPVFFPSAENRPTLITNEPAGPLTAVKVAEVDEKLAAKRRMAEPVTISEEVMPAQEDNLIVLADLALEHVDYAAQFIAAVKDESRDFSMTENEQPEAPQIASAATPFPFVPNSSFSYMFVDTSKPKMKVENYYEKNARESMVKAQKAVQQIDWQKIEKQLDKKVDIKMLRKEIEKSLEEVNWQAINEEVKLAQAKENAERMKMLRQESEELKKFRAEQIKLQQVQNELNARRELYKKNIEKQQQEILESMEDHEKIAQHARDLANRNCVQQQQLLQGKVDEIQRKKQVNHQQIKQYIEKVNQQHIQQLKKRAAKVIVHI